MRKVGGLLGTGSGGALGAIGTLVSGAEAAGEGIAEVVKYRRRIEDYIDEDGGWEQGPGPQEQPYMSNMADIVSY